MSVVFKAHVQVLNLVVALHLESGQLVVDEHLVCLDVDGGLVFSSTGGEHRVPVGRSCNDLIRYNTSPHVFARVSKSVKQYTVIKTLLWFVENKYLSLRLLAELIRIFLKL